MAQSYDAVIIGGGHNGLVTACYLAAGWKVPHPERRYLVGGGACRGGFPGLQGLHRGLRQQPVPQGNHPRPACTITAWRCWSVNPSSFTPFPDQRCLFLGPDAALNYREIAKFSSRDAETYPKYEAMLERVAAVIEPTLAAMVPPMTAAGRARFVEAVSAWAGLPQTGHRDE